MPYSIDAGIQISLNNTPTTATYASGGALGATTVVISAANSNITIGQTMSGTGIAPNTLVTNVSGTTITFSPAAVEQIAGTISFATTWYRLTDHNRAAIEISPELIETSNRMANGRMRKYVSAKKDTISTSWSFLPSQTVDTVDGFKSSAWLEAFYNANVGIPIYIKLINAVETVPALGALPNETSVTSATSSKIYYAFISSFSKTVVKRNSLSDFVDMSIEFVEV